MARWGEGDPRWIVEDRPDSINVNNWHWREKSADKWSSDYFNKSFTNLTFTDGSLFKGIITELSSVKGESTVSNRKGKLIYIYEYELVFKWIVNNKYQGTITVTNIAHDTSSSEFQFDIQFSNENNSSSYNDKVELFVKSKGIDAIKKVLDNYPEDLKAYAKDVVLPTNKTNSTESSCPHNSSKTLLVAEGKVPAPSTTKFDTITIVDEFKCSMDVMFQMLTDANLVNRWTRGNCQKYEGIENGEFVLYDRNITGRFTKLNRKEGIIEMLWRFKSWPEGFQSHVTISMFDQLDSVKLELRQENVPEYFLENTRDGWRRAYFEPIKIMFGFSTPFNSY